MRRLIALLAAASCALLRTTAAETTVTVGGCADLQSAAAATATDDVVAELSVEEITCDSWTNVEITTNRLKLVAGEGFADEDGFFFRNVRFVVSSGVLRMDFHAHFYQAEGQTVFQEVNGGAVYVAEGARARFMSHVYIEDVGVSTGTTDHSAITADAGHGGCFYNMGTIRFEKTCEIYRPTTSAAHEFANGDGGAVWNGETGLVVFKGEVNMADVQNEFTDGTGMGGLIFNAGKMSFFDDTAFSAGRASMGGIIYNSGELKFLKGTNVSFQSGYANEAGGHMYNSGTALFKTSATFYIGYTNGSGGGIYNTGSFTISAIGSFGGAEFTTNGAVVSGGAIYNTVDATLDIPDDTAFETNYILDDVNGETCDDIYQETEDGGFECQP